MLSTCLLKQGRFRILQGVWAHATPGGGYVPPGSPGHAWLVNNRDYVGRLTGWNAEIGGIFNGGVRPAIIIHQ